MRWVLLLLLLFSGTSCSPARDSSETTFMMGTFVEIMIRDFKGPDNIISGALGTIKDVEGTFNLYDEKSELSKINKSSDPEIKVSEDLFRLLQLSKEINALTNGMFDITLGPVQALWGFYGPEKRVVPSKDDISKELAKTGFDKIELNHDRTVKFKIKGMKLDMNAVSKGYAVDKGIAYLISKGVKNAIINAGGDVYCLGDNDGKGWIVGLRDPVDKSEIIATLNTSNRSIATSGGYENFFTLDGQAYQHIIDPATGEPVRNDVLSATAIAGKAALADGLATAFSILDPEESLSVADSIKGIDCVIICRDKDEYSYYISRDIVNDLKVIGRR